MARPPVCFCSAMDICLQESALIIVRDSLISLSLNVYYIRNHFVFLFFFQLTDQSDLTISCWRPAISLQFQSGKA